MQVGRFRIGSGRDNPDEVPASEVPEYARFTKYVTAPRARPGIGGGAGVKLTCARRASTRCAGGGVGRLFDGKGVRGHRYHVHDRPKYFGTAKKA